MRTKICNSLPSEVRILETVNLFKKRPKIHYFIHIIIDTVKRRFRRATLEKAQLHSVTTSTSDGGLHKIG